MRRGRGAERQRTLFASSRRCVTTAVAFTFLALYTSAKANEPKCAPLHVSTAQLPEGCQLLERTCVAQDTLVSHLQDHSFNKLDRQTLPVLPAVTRWSLPLPVAIPQRNVSGFDTAELPLLDINATLIMKKGRPIGDSKHVTEPPYYIYHRPATRSQEPTPELQNPEFSNCTLPVLLVGDWPFHLVSHFFSGLVALADFLVEDRQLDWPQPCGEGTKSTAGRRAQLEGASAREQGSERNSSPGAAIPRSATLVLAAPGGLSLSPAQALLLSRYSSRPPTSLGELGRLGPPGPVEWAGEGRRVHCFERVLVCQASNAKPGTGSPAPLAGNALAEELEADPQRPLPPDPAGFGPDAFPEGDGGGSGGGGEAKGGSSSIGSDNSSASSSVLRVLFERRGGPVRRISNLDALLKECRNLNKAGFSAGPFRRVECRAHDFDPDLSGTLVSPQQLYDNIAAVRSAHVLVAAHGEAAWHSVFMRHFPLTHTTPGRGGRWCSSRLRPEVRLAVERGAVGSALVEVRACGFGTAHAKHADAPLPLQLARGGPGAPLFFAYNVEDPGACAPGELQAAAEGIREGWRERAGPSTGGSRQDAGALGAGREEDEEEEQEEREASRRRLQGQAVGRGGRRGRSLPAKKPEWEPFRFSTGYLGTHHAALDQHVALEPGAFLRFLQGVAERVADRPLYESDVAAGRAHGYALGSGEVWMGPLGAKDVGR